jgi:hypothetical protein
VNKVILNWQRSVWEGDQEVVKRSGRDKSVGVVIHICMETAQGISLFSYLYLKLAKMPCLLFFFIFYAFSFTKSEVETGSREAVGTGGSREVVGKGVGG